MIVTTYGTRGSIPVAGVKNAKYGGNTTCLHIKSPCLPQDTYLVIDAGSGLMPLNSNGLAVRVKEVILFFTHYHHDHTQGLLLAPWTYMKTDVKLRLYGPEEHGIGPKQMLDHLMRPPFHPVSLPEVFTKDHMEFKGIQHPAEMAFVVHPQGGLKLCALHELEAAESGAHGQMVFRKSTRYSLRECLVVRMFRSNHPERTISYRFEERPTGRVFVFLTDHENQDSTPLALRNHLRGADLLIMDSQYTRNQYENGKAGFGHGTPDFCVGVANEMGIKELGLTHHDPQASDEAVDGVLREAHAAAESIGYGGLVKACRDFDEFKLD